MARSPLVPHLAFWTLGILIKLAFPSALKWLAYDNITLIVLSVWYPLCATIFLIHRDKGPQQLHGYDSLQIERQFWVEYWSVGFAGVQFVHRFISLVPWLRQMGRHDYPQLPIILSEVKLLYFLWIFVMETLLAHYQRFLGFDEQKAYWKQFVPLTFLTKTIGPRLMRVQMTVSEQISKETWQRYIKRKTQKVFELLVMLQFLEVESMDYMLQLLEEGRSLVLLSIFMVLPAAICELGMLYPQFIFPSARSLVARGDELEILSLKYWVLNNIISLFLSATWWLWWCIPFSNQILLGIRCFATFPTIISYFYHMVEMDLVTFGILSGQAELTVKETKTVQVLRALVKRVPRDKNAQSFQFEIDEPLTEYKNIDDDSSIGSEDTTESEEERRRKRRREKRAKKKLLKQKKLSGSSMTSSSTRPPPLLSESFIARYASDDESERKTKLNDNESIEEEENYSSFINTNEKKSKFEHVATKLNQRSVEKEQRDARNAASKDLTSQAEIRHATSFSTANDECSKSELISSSLSNDTNTLNERVLLPSTTIGSNYSSSHSRLTSLSIATPTESIVGEVEVRVKGASGISKQNTKSKSASLFPATHPAMAGRGLTMPLSFSDELSTKSSVTSLNAFSFRSQSQVCDNENNNGANSGLYLSDIDTAASSTVGSFDVWSPASNTDKMAPLKEQEQHEDENIVSENLHETNAPPRRSSRLVQLREWQEKKRQDEELERKKKLDMTALKTTSKKQGKKSKQSTKNQSSDIEKSSTKGSSEKSTKAKSKSVSVGKKSKKSTIPSAEIATKDSVVNKSTATSVAKRVKKKSSAASPDKSSNKQKGETPSKDDVGLADSSSPGKKSRTKSKKVPNSRRKKASMFGGVLGRN